MATATLILNEPQRVTCEALTTNLREVVVPAGTRYLEYTSTAPWFYENDDGQIDGGATTVVDQMRLEAGTSSIRMPGSGAGRSNLVKARSLFIVGTVASQQVWLTGTSRAP